MEQTQKSGNVGLNFPELGIMRQMSAVARIYPSAGRKINFLAGIINRPRPGGAISPGINPETRLKERHQ